MMKNFAASAAMLLALITLMTQAPTLADSETPAQKKSDAAVDLVIQLFGKHGQKVSSLKLECLTFSADDEPKPGAAAISVVARELHNTKCGGDPETSPLVVIFKVKGKQVFVEDPISGGTQPFP